MVFQEGKEPNEKGKKRLKPNGALPTAEDKRYPHEDEVYVVNDRFFLSCPILLYRFAQ
jgi:hypothetical protein